MSHLPELSSSDCGDVCWYKYLKASADPVSAKAHAVPSEATSKHLIQRFCFVTWDCDILFVLMLLLEDQKRGVSDCMTLLTRS